MTNKEVVSTAIKEVEKDKQEAEIKKIKDIAKAYLEKIEGKEKEVKEAQEDLRALKSDLDDLKAGRLDKIEERQGKDKEHDQNTLIIIKKVEKEYIPYQPWRSQWVVEIKQATYTDNVSGITWAGTGTISNSNSILHTTGTTCQNFTTGTYNIGGHIINL